MHEVSLARQLAAAVTRVGQGREVAAVQVEVGDLRQVVPDSLAYAWTFVVRDTPLQDARLEISRCPAVLSCRACGADTKLGAELGFTCRSCGSSDTWLASGDQFRLSSIDVHNPDAGPPGATIRPPTGVRHGTLSPA